MQPETPNQSRSLPRISKLPDALINQIAAGEVVERPSSAVKELVENSLDSGATRIEVYLQEGGMQEILIVDNGWGMGPEDLILSVQRHTTSKLSALIDLDNMGTYGFRGEALSSIASVAEVEIRSRTEGEAHALVLTVSHGQLNPELRPTSGPIGTSLKIRELFQRIPARQKFLRSSSTEFSHCARVLRELALGNASVSFSLHHQDRLLYSYSAGSRVTRFKQCIKVNWEPFTFCEVADDVTVEAFLSPAHFIQDRGEIFFFVNGRSVKNKGLMACVRNAYLSTLGPHHEPSGAVFLDIRKDWVDVNVHPQKLEVRLLRQESLYGWMSAAIKKRLSMSRIAETALPQAFPAPAESNTWPSSFRETSLSFQGTVFSPSRTEPTSYSTPISEQVNTASFEPTPSDGLKYLGQVKNSYLLCEYESGILLVDQHAAEEKFCYERLKESFGSGLTNVQELLLPLIIKIPQELHPLLEEHRTAFQSAGLDIEIFGEGDVAVKSRPQMLPEAELENVIRDALGLLDAETVDKEKAPAEALETLMNPIWVALACHSVVQAGQALSPGEAKRILSNLTKIEEGWTCPHGRPVLFRLSFRNIEKHFERI